MRKAIPYSLLLVLFLISACNLPARSRPGGPAPTQTAAPAILDTPAIPTLIVPSPGARLAPTPTSSLTYDPDLYSPYAVQSGDTLNVVAAHFGVAPGDILSAQPLPAQGLLPNALALAIPRQADPFPASRFLLPDSEIVNSPCGQNFDIQKFVADSKGLLSTYSQVVEKQTLSGAEVVERVSQEASVHPHFLLAFIEFRSHWVLGSPSTPDLVHPLGLNIPNNEGLYAELAIYANLVNIGYYAWRQGEMATLTFEDGGSARIAPALNAGSVALQYLFARSYAQSAWEDALYGAQGFLATYQNLFGDPMTCTNSLGSLFPDGLQPPTLELPFAPGEPWALTGGLHEDWVAGTPEGALDFAPITGEPPCTISRAWVLASAAGIVTRAQGGALQLALTDAAGQPTGWELLYMHVAAQDRLPAGTHVKTDDRLGHPSCEGGVATGTHVHLARLYRGEWIGAGASFPFTLSGWLAVPGASPYHSTLVKGSQVVTSNINGTRDAQITR